MPQTEDAERYLADARRRVWDVADVRGAEAWPVAQVGVVGAGTMGSGIAIAFLMADAEVVLVEQDGDALGRRSDAIRETILRAARKGRIGQDVAAARIARLTATRDMDALASCDLIVEAIFETMALKTALFAALDRIAKPGALLATNTSFLDVEEIAAATRRPENVLGLHFFAPANVMTMLEVVRCKATSAAALATALGVARRLGKTPVIAGVCPGFIGNRMLARRQAAAQRVLLEGASAAAIDAVHLAFGMPMGPFQMSDLSGLDVGWHRDPARIESLRDAMCAAGRLGQKNRAGYYDYDADRKPHPSDAAAAILTGYRRQAGVTPRPIGEAEILERTLYPVVNEGALVLDERIARQASDIDVLWVLGYGWPAAKGGPMYWGAGVGARRLADGLARWRQDAPDRPIAPGLLQAAQDGATSAPWMGERP